MKRYSEEVISQIISEYINGQPLSKLAVEYNIDYSTIKNWLIKRNVADNGTGRFSQKYEINDDYAEIYIKSKGDYVKAMIDIEDVDRCKGVGIWSITKAGYVVNCKSGIYLHRFIMNCPNDMEVDHKNHNLLDNRKSELRIATSSQQKMNTHIRKDNTSGYRGIYYDKGKNKWAVSLQNEGKRIMKRFENIEDAVLFRDNVINETRKEFALKEGDYDN